MKLSSRVHVPYTATGKINDLAQQKRREGKLVYNFAAGDPALPVHPAIMKGIQEELEKAGNQVLYPPIAGLDSLRHAAAQWMGHYTVDETLVTHGGKFALYALTQALLEPGDEALIAAPYWVSYLPMVHMCDAIPRLVHTADWKITPEALEQVVSSRTKLLIINNGCNPTGILYRASEIEAILKWAAAKNIFVLSDEVYSEIIFDGRQYISCSSFPQVRHNVAVIQSCSKNFGMTGWRVGFIFAPVPLIKAIATLQGQSLTGACLVSQWAALAALKQSQEIVTQVRTALIKRRDCCVAGWKKWFSSELIPAESGIYQWIPMQQCGVDRVDSQVFCEQAMEEASVALVPGIAFGVEGYIRLSFSEDEASIEQGIEALARWCRKVK